MPTPSPIQMPARPLAQYGIADAEEDRREQQQHRQQGAGPGRADKQAEDQQRPHCLEGDDHSQGYQRQHNVVVQAGREAGYLRLFGAEAQHHERPGANDSCS